VHSQTSLGNDVSIFAGKAVWNAAVRILLFWILVATGLFALAHVTPYSDWRLISGAINVKPEGILELVTQQAFAFALASAIVQFGLALGLAFLVAHVLLIHAALGVARQALGLGDDHRHFAATFDGVAQKLRQHAIIGHAWREFEETLVRSDDVVRNTVRPQSFINLAHAREQLFGLKMMGSIPGFFVGLGLLLTFIGLVLALNKAAGSTTASSASDMTEALHGLLDAATFKFSTSIAGLGASLGLSLLFRIYQISIERAFDRFGRALEDRLQFQPPQRTAVDSLKLLVEQRDQLREINSEAFFARLGDSIGPRFQTAVAEAISPVSSSLDDTMKALTQTSRTGVEELIKTFISKLDQGAGRELGQVVETLVSLRDGLEDIRRSLTGSGQDVSDKLAAAAEDLSRVIADAGTALSDSAAGAAGTVVNTMERLAGKLEAQSTAFGEKMAALQNGVTAQMEESGRIAQKAGEEAANASKRAADEAAEAMRTTMGDMVQKLSTGIGQLSAALQDVESKLRAQTQHIEILNTRSRETADAFDEVAANVRSASQPLLTSSERVVQSTGRMAESIASSVDALSATQRTASGIAEKLEAHLTQIANVWNQYEARFRGVDEDLERAAKVFHEEVSRHQEAMRNFVADVDRHTGAILTGISSTVNDLDGSIQDLTDTLAPFVQRMTRGEAAE
jgi:phosphoribosyl-ATP pyrophosphohydrolase